MKQFFVPLVAMFLTFSALAETPSQEIHESISHVNGETNGVGAGGTVFFSWGFMYRRHFSNNFGFSTSLGGWFTNNSGYLGNELGLLYTLAHHRFSWTSLPKSSIRVYVAGYFANIYHRDREFFEYPYTTHSLHTGIGAGPGLEFFFNRHFAIHLELPWMTFFKIARNNATLRDSYPHFGGGLIYYF